MSWLWLLVGIVAVTVLIELARWRRRRVFRQFWGLGGKRSAPVEETPPRWLGEWCSVCLRDFDDMDDGAVWVRRHYYATVEGEDDGGGGTYSESFYCRGHAPSDAVPCPK